MKALIDINILLDFFFDRQPWADDAEKVLALIQSGKCIGVVAATSIDHLHYIGRRLGGLEQARKGVQTCLRLMEIAPVDALILRMAIEMPGTDFEDNIVIASGIRAGAEIVCTRDSKGFRSAQVPVVTAGEFLQLHNGRRV